MRVGLIIPSSNTVMEPDFHRHLGTRAVISTTRIFLEDVTREAELRMIEDDLPRAVDLIRTTSPDVVVFGCTSAGAMCNNQGIGKAIAEGSGARVVTVLDAVISRLRKIGARRVAVFTPYETEPTAGVAASLEAAGFAVVKASGMGIRSNLQIGGVEPAAIVKFVGSGMAGIQADCLFLSCTNWRAVEARETLQHGLNLPVITSNAAAIEEVRDIA